MPYYPNERRRPATGGIKATNKRGAFGEKPWSREWVRAVEGPYSDSRMSRGRTYARMGQVTGLEVEPGKIRAQVQGSRRTPYRVTIESPALTDLQRNQVLEGLEDRSRAAAQLYAGIMPSKLEPAFWRADAGLVPDDDDLSLNCSCPDWSSPCKHVLAVAYVLAEQMDQDPFWLLAFRGLTPEDFEEAEEEGAIASEPLTGDGFWHAGTLPEVEAVQLDPWFVGSFLDRMGKFPLWRGVLPLGLALRDSYAEAARAGARILTPTRRGRKRR